MGHPDLWRIEGGRVGLSVWSLELGSGLEGGGVEEADAAGGAYGEGEG